MWNKYASLSLASVQVCVGASPSWKEHMPGEGLKQVTWYTQSKAQYKLIYYQPQLWEIILKARNSSFLIAGYSVRIAYSFFHFSFITFSCMTLLSAEKLRRFTIWWATKAHLQSYGFHFWSWMVVDLQGKHFWKCIGFLNCTRCLYFFFIF